MPRPRPRPIVEDEEVKERKVSAQVEVWLGPDGQIVTVNESAHLGTQVMSERNPGAPDTIAPIYECVGAYGIPDSKTPVVFTLESLGTIGVTEKLGESVHAVTKDVMFNAFSWLDEPEKVDALSDAERIRLSNIGVVELNNIVIAALLATPRIWTPLVDAAMAIMQHALGESEEFPEPIITTEPDMVAVEDHADDVKATLKVGDHTFTVGDKYWRFCSYGICNEKPRYAFTWMDVPESFLKG